MGGKTSLSATSLSAARLFLISGAVKLFSLLRFDLLEGGNIGGSKFSSDSTDRVFLRWAVGGNIGGRIWSAESRDLVFLRFADGGNKGGNIWLSSDLTDLSFLTGISKSTFCNFSLE